MPLTRKHTWAERDLPEFIASRKDTPFTWGTNDCCLIAADAILAITGTDIAADFRGKYTDDASAFALIRSVSGGATVADAAVYCATKFGLVEWKFPLQAQRGDLVVIDDGGQLIAGFIGSDGRFAVSVGPAGRKYIPHENVKRAWKV